MQGVVPRAEESAAEWVRPCSHILSPAARSWRFLDAGGEEVEVVQGSKLGAIRTEGMSSSRRERLESLITRSQG